LCYRYRLPPVFRDNKKQDEEEQVYSLGTIGKYLENKPWGGSTNFNASMRLMLQAIRHKYPEGTNRRQFIIVFTDMQFDCADAGSGHIKNFDLMRQEFAEARVPMPTLVIWNIRSDIEHTGLPTSVSEKNVVYLSGYSADLLQDFFGMLGKGQFESKVGEAEDDPNVECWQAARCSTFRPWNSSAWSRGLPCMCRTGFLR
jgi:hypothetical protein